MKPRFVAIAAAAVSAAAIATPAVAQSSGEGQILTFREVEKGSTFAFVDHAPRTTVGRHGPRRISVGDEFVFTTALSDARGHLGRLRAKCTATRATRRFDRAHFLCSGAFILRYGTLFAEVANVGGGKVTRGAVTGGTGAYAGAHGSFISTEMKAGANDVVTLLP